MKRIDDILLSDENWPLKYCVYLFAIIGLIRFKVFVIKTLCFLGRHCCRCRQNLLRKYSDKGNPKSTWAVVTGGSDGIGLEFCHKFARQGFNICIISRSKSRIDAKLKEITDLYPNI